MPRNKICIIGSGPTSVYILKYLLASSRPLHIVVFEAEAEAGKGMPYRSQMNADYMLCNAFSREIPPVTRTLMSWLADLPKQELGEWELSYHDLSPRAFYPRLLIGNFFASEFDALCSKLQHAGHTIAVKTNERVVAIDVIDNGQTSVLSDKMADATVFDHVVIASGHCWPESPHIDKATLLSPWPYTNVTALPPGNIGILGSSLSAIDIVVALGSAHGEFDNHADRIVWRANHAASNLKITMVSKMGIIPEADFFYPYPYAPLQCLTPEAVEAEVLKGADGLLARLFDLLCNELDEADRGYMKSLGPQARTLHGFSEAYFMRRQDLGARAALKDDFAKARQSMKQRQTIPARYVLLRGHEVFDKALRSLDETDWNVFKATLLPVFTDSYAAVPHLSLARVIAMTEANVLSVRQIGNDATFSNNEHRGVAVETPDGMLNFDVLIDARGQASAPLKALPFPDLVAKLANDADSVEVPFRLAVSGLQSSSIFCLALPQMLERYPFSQGLANSAENAKIVVGEILKTV